MGASIDPFGDLSSFESALRFDSSKESGCLAVGLGLARTAITMDVTRGSERCNGRQIMSELTWRHTQRRHACQREHKDVIKDGRVTVSKARLIALQNNSRTPRP